MKKLLLITALFCSVAASGQNQKPSYLHWPQQQQQGDTYNTKNRYKHYRDTVYYTSSCDTMHGLVIYTTINGSTVTGEGIQTECISYTCHSVVPIDRSDTTCGHHDTMCVGSDTYVSAFIKHDGAYKFISARYIFTVK